ncbi:hypothetical protein D3C80_1124850 [compost metagenome]
MSEVQEYPKAQVLVNQRLVLPDAFTNPSIYLYLPTDAIGNMTCPLKAVRIECWKRSTGEVKRSVLADIFSSNRSGLAFSLLKHHAELEFGMLTMSVAFGSLKVLNDWLHTLERFPAGDLNRFDAYYTPGK